MKLIISFILLINANFCKANSDSTFQLIKTLHGQYQNCSVDNLGNIYLIGDRNEILKLDNHFDSVASFNDVGRYGNLTSIDASNPLKVLLFYKDFLTVVVLDRTLETRNSIDLRAAGVYQCSVISQSYDNKLWLFDEVENKIKKIDEDGKAILESSDFRVLFDDPPKPTVLNDHNKNLFAYESSKGLLIMDYYGSYKNLVALKNLKNVQSYGNGIVATDSTGLIYFELGAIDTKHQNLPQEILIAKKIIIYNQFLYALFKDGELKVYQMN